MGEDDDQRGSAPNDVSSHTANNVEAPPTSSASNNDKIYEPKSTRKVIRVLTVLAYVFFVSLAAIMLSLYYIFLWDPVGPERGRLEARVDPWGNFNATFNATASKC